MSDTESTQLWNDEDDEVQGGQDFSAALASLEGHLQEYKEQDQHALEDDEAMADALLYEEGVSYEPAIDENGEPSEVSLADLTEEDALPDHGTQPEEDAGFSLDGELEAAFVEEEAPIDSDLDAALAAEDNSFASASAVEESADDDGFLSEEEPAEADFAAYPSYEEPEEDMDNYSAPVAEAPVESPMSAMMGGHDGADDFNLATLTQLVDEIRQESDRVSEMKDSVARALSLIQEMSESLKS